MPPPGNRSHPPRTVCLRLEPLEERNLLSVTVLENFESGTLDDYRTLLRFYPDAAVVPAVAQDGRNTLIRQDGYEWIVRGSPAQPLVRQGQTLSAWVQFPEAADGRAYLGFGANPQRFAGTYSLVLAANTNQLMLQLNTNGWMHGILAAAGQAYEANHWYRMEVVWNVGGGMRGRVYDSDGVTLLNEVTATNLTFNAGGIAFRAFGNNKYFHTVVRDDDSSATPRELAEAGGGLLKGWEPSVVSPPQGNLDSGGNAHVPWAYGDWLGSNRDVELQVFNQLLYVATVNGRVGLAAGNVSRVIPGTSSIDWGPAHCTTGSCTPPPETPLLAQYMFRQVPGEPTRLIGASDVKHFFAPFVLNPAETDAYSNDLNAVQSFYIPGSELEPVTGRLHRRSHFGGLSPDGINLYQNHGHADRIEHLLQVAVEDLDPALWPAGTRWYLMGHLWVAGDQNVANNSRWLEVRPQRAGASFSFLYPGGMTGQLNFRTIPDLYEPGGPFVLAQSPRSLMSGPVDRVRVRYNTPLDVTTFTPDQVYLYDPEINPIPVTAVVPVDGSGGREFDLFFDAQTAEGFYYLWLGLGILDLYGNPPDQDQNGVAGEDADWYLGGFRITGGGGSPSGGGAELAWGLGGMTTSPVAPVLSAGSLQASSPVDRREERRDGPALAPEAADPILLPSDDGVSRDLGDALDRPGEWFDLRL